MYCAFLSCHCLAQLTAWEAANHHLISSFSSSGASQVQRAAGHAWAFSVQFRRFCSGTFSLSQVALLSWGCRGWQRRWQQARPAQFAVDSKWNHLDAAHLFSIEQYELGSWIFDIILYPAPGKRRECLQFNFSPCTFLLCTFCLYVNNWDMAGYFCKAVNLYSWGGKIYGVGTNVHRTNPGRSGRNVPFGGWCAWLSFSFTMATLMLPAFESWMRLG